LSEVVAIDNRQLGREIIALKRIAAFLAVGGEVRNSPQQAN
jgi:hypothetical protein